MTGKARITALAGDRLAKRYADAWAARRALDLSHAALAAGLRTPPAARSGEAAVLIFHRIAGRSGIALVRDRPLETLLRPLRDVHGLALDPLPRFDPFARIMPRLTPALPEGIVRRIEVLRARTLPAGGPVHGDFHPGQLIEDAEARIWIIDLDDMGWGPPEADLGNLAAYLATRPETALGLPSIGATLWSERIAAAYGPCDRDLLGHLAEIALFRRALKLAERGDVAVLTALAIQYG
jgi:Phosphotransferase enzyme family